MEHGDSGAIVCEEVEGLCGGGFLLERVQGWCVACTVKEDDGSDKHGDEG